MKKLGYFGLFLSMLTSAIGAMAQKVITEGTIVYNMEIRPGNGTSMQNGLVTGASNTVYVKGNNSRVDMISSLGNETTIHDAKLGNAVILKEFSGQKLMIRLNHENWITKNSSYNNIKFDLLDETKKIAGYSCRKALAKMTDGKTFIVYYTTELTVANKEYNPTFTNLPGLAMEYEIESGNMIFRFTVSKISLEPVQISKFDFPRAGYRVMTYEENMQMRKGN